MSNITNKVVVITGASSGIGESTAKVLAQQGAKVVLGARRKDRIDAVVQDISATGAKAIGFACDVTKRAEVEALIQKAVDNFGRVDVIVNNAGIMPIAPIEALKVDEWDRQIDVNIKGLLYGVAAGPATHAEAEDGPHHQYCFGFWDQNVRPRRDGLLRHQGGCARVDGRAADGTAFPKHSLHDHFTWRDCHRAGGKQFGRSDQKEFTRVHENGHPGQRDRESDRLRNRAAGRGGSR